MGVVTQLRTSYSFYQKEPEADTSYPHLHKSIKADLLHLEDSTTTNQQQDVGGLFQSNVSVDVGSCGGCSLRAPG